jgi:hypothetical protein
METTSPAKIWNLSEIWSLVKSSQELAVGVWSSKV